MFKEGFNITAHLTASNLKQVVCSTEETERDPGGLAQILMKALHTSEAVNVSKYSDKLNIGFKIKVLFHSKMFFLLFLQLDV